MGSKPPALYLNRAQLAVLHLAKKELRLDDDTYRAILFRHGEGVESARDLTTLGFIQVMDHFARLGFRSTRNKRHYGPRPGMASPSQIKFIRGLWRDWSGGDDDAALNHWLERSFGVSALRFLDAAGAQKAITGLKRMADRRRGNAPAA